MKYTWLLLLLLLSACSTNPATIGELKTEIEDYLSNEEGTYAVVFADIDDPGRQIMINPDTMFHAASTMKTPVMIEVFRQAEAGSFSLQDSIRIQNEFTSIVDGSDFSIDLNPAGDDPYARKVGEMATIYNLTHAMITYSSNLATNLIIELVGAEETTQTMRQLGAESIEILRGVNDMKAFNQGLNNRTTARDLSIILRSIAEEKIVSSQSSQMMIDILADQFYRDIIPKHLPDEVRVGNKTGFISGIEHDSALIFLPDGRSYTLVYLSKEVPDGNRSRETGAAISKMIYDFYMENRSN